MTLTIDLGCGSYCRGDVGVDVNFKWKNPYHRPEFFDKLTHGKVKDPDLVLADLNYPLPFRDKAFDRAFLVHVIEHLYRPYELLKEIHRILKDNGELIIICPNAKVSFADWNDDTHLISFTEPTLKRFVSLVFRHVEVKVLEESPYCRQDLYCKARK